MRGEGRRRGVLLLAAAAALLLLLPVGRWLLEGDGLRPGPLAVPEPPPQADGDAGVREGGDGATAAAGSSPAPPPTPSPEPTDSTPFPAGKGDAPPAWARTAGEGKADAKTRILEGRVVDTLTGKPIAGAVIRVDLRYLWGVGLLEATTDDAGHYRLEGLPARRGLFPVRVSAPGFVERRTTGGLPGTPEDALQFSLSPASVVRGRVLDPRGAPVAGARIFVDGIYGRTSMDRSPERQFEYSRFGPGLERSDFLERMLRLNTAATTDAAGRFEVADLPVAQTLTLVAAADGHSPSLPLRDLVIPPGSAGENVTLTLRPDTVLSLRVVPPEGIALEGEIEAMVSGLHYAVPLRRTEEGAFEAGGLAGGRTWYLVTAPPLAEVMESVEVEPGKRNEVLLRLAAGDSLAGQVVDGKGAGVGGLGILVQKGGGGRPVLSYRTDATTDDGGRFEVRGLADGTHDLWLKDDEAGFEALQGAWTPPAHGLRLPAPGSLRFRLVPPTGAPIPEDGCFTVHHSPEKDRFLHSAWWGRNLAYDPETGIASLRRTYPGRTTLAVKVPGFVEVRRTLEVPAGDEADFGDLALVPSLRARGRVRDPEGEPVPRALVTAWYPDGVSSSSRTALDGTFELVDLAPATVTVEVQDAGSGGTRFALALTRESIHAGMAPLDLVLKPGGAIRVRVLDAAGLPVAVSHVACEPDGKWYRPFPLALEPTGEPGEFLGRRMPGPFVVQVLDPDRSWRTKPLASAPVGIREGAEAFREIRLPK